MDTTTLIVISTLIQTVVITVTPLVFILQFRSQEQAIRESSYQGLMGRYNDLIREMVEKPELAKLLVGRLKGDGSAEVSDTEAAVYGYFLLAYGIIEEAFLLYSKKWIDEDNWQQWSAFLETLSENSQFVTIHSRTSGTFDPDFEDYVRKIFSKKQKPKNNEEK